MAKKAKPKRKPPTKLKMKAKPNWQKPEPESAKPGPIDATRKAANWQGLYRAMLAECVRLERDLVACQRRLDNVPETIRQLMQEAKAGWDRVAELKARLANVLSPEQLDAANAAGCEPAEYAINLIKLCKHKVDELTRFR